AELEEEGAIAVPQHDAGGDRRCSAAQGDDLALAGLGERWYGAANEGGIACVLGERGAALALPAAGFELQEGFERRSRRLGCARDLEGDGAVPFEAAALTAQLLELLRSERIAQQRLTVARRIEAGAEMRGQHARCDAAAIERCGQRLQRRTL